MLEWKSIGTICSNIFAGGTPSTKHLEYYDGTIPWIRSGEIDFNVITKAERNITELGYKNSSAKKIRPNSVVMAMTGATVAKSAVVEIETTANQSVCAMETDESVVNYKYLFYYLAEEYFAIKSSAQGALTSLNLAMIKQIQIPIPSLSDQSRIVGILDTFTASIENLKQRIEQRRKQYAHYSNNLLKHVDRKESIWKKLSELADIFKGPYITKKDSNEGEFPVIMGGQKVAYYIDRYNSEGESIVISRSGINAGFVSFWNQPIFVSDGYRIDNKEIINKKYLFYFLKKNEDIINSSKKGAGVPHIQSNYLLSFLILVPSLPEQQRIVSILDTFEASIANLEQQLAQRERQYEYYRNKLLTFE